MKQCTAGVVSNVLDEADEQEEGKKGKTWRLLQDSHGNKHRVQMTSYASPRPTHTHTRVRVCVSQGGEKACISATEQNSLWTLRLMVLSATPASLSATHWYSPASSACRTTHTHMHTRKGWRKEATAASLKKRILQLQFVIQSGEESSICVSLSRGIHKLP